MPKRKNSIAAVAIPVIIGIGVLIRLMGQPEFTAIRTADVVQLVGSGMCFGAALVALIAVLRERSDS